MLLESLGRPSILCLTETWFTVGECDLFVLPGYSLAASFCRSRKRGGGVAIFVCSSLYFTKPIIAVESVECLFEFALVRVRCAKEWVNIVSLYRAPGCDIGIFGESLERLLTVGYESGLRIFVCADFNVDFQNVADRGAADVRTVFASFNLFPRVAEHT